MFLLSDFQRLMLSSAEEAELAALDGPSLGGISAEGRDALASLVRAADAVLRQELIARIHAQTPEFFEETMRTRLDGGELGQEGFATSLRLGGNTVRELKRIVFRPPPQDD